jgi:hypothetical protein
MPLTENKPVGPEAASVTVVRAAPEGNGGTSSVFSRRVLNFGFKCGVFLAGTGLFLSAAYLGYFLFTTSAAIEGLLTNPDKNQQTIELAISARMVMARLALLSSGAFIGMSFGFLGFSLFLIGIQGEMEVEAKSESHLLKFARLSPGVFVIFCAVLLVGICVTRSNLFEYSRERPVGVTPTPANKLTDALIYRGATNAP